jgi:hypothetical protein
VQRLADLAPLLGPACARDLVKVREDQAFTQFRNQLEDTAGSGLYRHRRVTATFAASNRNPG